MLRVTDVVRHLLIINVLVYFASLMLGEPAYGNITDLSQLGRLRLAMYYPSSPFFQPYQVVTHMFMHADVSHLFFNMIGLFFFGPPLENIFGPKKFFSYYLITGFGALALYLFTKYLELNFMGAPISSINIPMLGASGAIYGLLIGFATKFPDNIISLIFPPISMKAKYFALIFVGFDLFAGLGSFDTGIAHFAHVGGALFGFLTIMFWDRTGKRR